MNTVWKVAVPKKCGTYKVMANTPLCSVQLQGGSIAIWFIVEGSQKQTEMTILVTFTGFEVPDGAVYLATLVDDESGLVYQVWAL